MRILHQRKLYLSALSLVAVALLLLIIVGVSTYRNLDRQKVRAMDSLRQQGLALINSIEAGARTGMRMNLWQEVSIGNLMRDTAESTGIAYVYLIGSKGIIVHHSNPVKSAEPSAWTPELIDKDQVIYRTVRPTGKNGIYEIAKYFSPMYTPNRKHHPAGIFGQEHSQTSHSHGGEIIVLGISMATYEEARREDIHHAFIMAAIIFSLGTGALFFIFVIQNYYLVNRTLKETQDYTRQILASMANGLISIDLESKITSYNLPALKILELEEFEVKNRNLNEIIDFGVSGIAETLQSKCSLLDREIYYPRKDGEFLPVALSAAPIFGETGDSQGAVVILRDLSELKRLEEKVQRTEKLAAIGELAAGVAHEIRNPLSSIRGFAQFLKHSLKDRPQEQEYADTMVIEIDRINSVITDLLTFSRPMKVEQVPTDIHDFLGHCTRLVEADTFARNVTMKLVQPKNIDTVNLDSNQMTQALLNLLLNALQVVEDGGRIELGAEYYPDSNIFSLWVENDGTVIPEIQQNKIFEPFFTTRETGTGLGLPIVHKIVENHGGEISLKSPRTGKDSGTRFTIKIPADA